MLDDDYATADSLGSLPDPRRCDRGPAERCPRPGPAAATEAPAATEPAGTEPADGGGEGEELALATTDLGEVVVDDEGLTMYLFTPDAQGDTSVCVDDCAEAWPPQTEISEVGGGLDEALLGTITDPTAPRGHLQRLPLYYSAATARRRRQRPGPQRRLVGDRRQRTPSKLDQRLAGETASGQVVLRPNGRP